MRGREILVFVLSAALLALCWVFWERAAFRGDEIERLGPRRESLLKEIAQIPPAAAQGRSDAAERLNKIENEIRQIDASLNERSRAALQDGAGIRKEGAAKLESKIPASLQPFLKPPDKRSSPEQLRPHALSTDLLHAAAAAGVERVDLLLVPKSDPNSKEKPARALQPVQFRFRSTKESLWKFLSSLSAPEAPGLVYQIDRIRIRPASTGETGLLLADLDLSAVLPAEPASPR